MVVRDGALHGRAGRGPLVATTGAGTIAIFTTVRFAVIPVLCVAGWGITCFVLYLSTGRAGLRFAVAAYYAALGVGFVLVDALTPPTHLVVTGWQATLEPKPAGVNVVYGLFAVPLLLGTLGYASLYRRARAPIQRYRIALVSAAIRTWVVSGLAANIGTSPMWRFITVTVLGLVAALAVLFAHRPPGSLRAKLDPDPLDAYSFDTRRERLKQELQRRVSELV